MARRATSLGPKPSLFYFFCFFVFFCFVFFFVFLFVFFGGFKGQVRWPEGPPHLALNPPYFICFVFFCFLFFCFFLFFVFYFLFVFFVCFCLFFVFGFVSKKPVFPPKQGIFCVFCFLCLPLFLFSLVSLSPVSLSLSLSFFVSLLFFSFFLPSCF